jgi:hypothetical protein
MNKSFLITVVTQDGEHEYRSYAVTSMRDLRSATKRAEASKSFFDFQDGLTLSRIQNVQQISDEDADTLIQLRVAHTI